MAIFSFVVLCFFCQKAAALLLSMELAACLFRCQRMKAWLPYKHVGISDEMSFISPRKLYYGIIHACLEDVTLDLRFFSLEKECRRANFTFHSSCINCLQQLILILSVILLLLRSLLLLSIGSALGTWAALGINWLFVHFLLHICKRWQPQVHELSVASSSNLFAMFWRRLARGASGRDRGSVDAEGRPPESSAVAECRALWEGFKLADNNNFHGSTFVEQPEPLVADAGLGKKVDAGGKKGAGDNSWQFVECLRLFEDKGPGRQEFGGKKPRLAKKVVTRGGKNKRPRMNSGQAVDEPCSIDVSVTVSVGGLDVWEALYVSVCKFLDQECMSGVVSQERGSELDHLHIQCVFRVVVTNLSTPAMVNVRLKKYLGWDTHKPAGGIIICKALKDTKLHCYEGMIGYCLKDLGKMHFRQHVKNVSAEQMARGKDLYALYGAGDIKACVTLDNRNLLARACHFVLYHGKRQLSASLEQAVTAMLRTHKFVLSSAWVLPLNCAFISQQRVEAAWRLTLNPGCASIRDVRSVIFGTPPGIVPVERVGKRRKRYWDDMQIGPEETDDDDDLGGFEHDTAPTPAPFEPWPDFIPVHSGDKTVDVD